MDERKKYVTFGLAWQYPAVLEIKILTGFLSVQVHTETRDYECHCGKRFKRSTHLRRHISSTVHQSSSSATSVFPSGDTALKAELGDGGNWGDLVNPLAGEKEEPQQLRHDPDRRSELSHDKYGGSGGGGVPISGSAALAVVSTLDFSPKLEARERYKGPQAESYDKVKPSYRIPRTGTKYPAPGNSSSQKHSYYLDTGRAFSRNPEAEPDVEMDMSRGGGNGGRGYLPLSPQPHQPRYSGTSGVEPPAANKSAYHPSASSYSMHKSYPPPEVEDKQPYLPAERLTTTGGGGDKLSAMYPTDFKHYLVDSDREYGGSSYDKYGLGPEKSDYGLQMGGDKNYQDYLSLDKSHLLAGSPEEKQQQTYHHHHQHPHHHHLGHQQPPPLPPVDDGRLFQSRDGGYNQSLDPRLLSSHPSAADLRPDPLFMDAGPADLTMASKDLITATSRSESRADLSLSLYCGSNSSPTRHHVVPQQYRHHHQRPSLHHGQRGTTTGGPPPPPDPSRLYETGRSGHHFVSPRGSGGQPPPPADLYRSSSGGDGGSRLASQTEPLLLEDSAYRSLQDLGYSVRPPNHYYDQLDAYFHPASRGGLDLDDGYEKRQPKYPKQEKYYR